MFRHRLLATKTVLFPTCLFFVMNMLFSGVLSAQKTDGASPFSFPPAPMIEAAADKSAAQISAPAAAASGESSAKNQNAVSKQDSAKRNTAGKNADSASVSSQKETNTKRSVSEQGTAKKQPSEKIVPNKTESKTADKPKLIRYAFLNGTRYVNLHDVASFYGMMLHQYMKFIILKNKKHQVQFFLKSRKVILDSVQITFHFPMEKKNGSWYISELDFRTILNPIFRQKLSVRSSLKTIMIDAGHGGKDSGAKGLIKNEKTINLEIAKKLSGKLEAMGFKVYLTRSNDIYPTLPERSAMCQKLKADLFISIHCNSHTKKNVSGIETFQLTPKGAPSSSETKPQNAETPANKYNPNNLRLAYEIQKALTRSFPKAEDRGVKHARFFVLKNASCPAVLIEAGFISNRTEEKILASSVGQTVIADSIQSAVKKYSEVIK